MKTLRLWFAAIYASVWVFLTHECSVCDGTGDGVHMNYDFPCERCQGKGRIY